MSNDQFERHMAQIKKSDINSYLTSMSEPCYESTLLRIAYPDINIVQCNTLELYQHHFILFHHLYHLQEKFAQKGQYLHVHFMRTQVLDYPAPGHCRFFDELYHKFCNESCDSSGNYCAFHRRKVGETELDALSIRYFYLDINNYYKLDEKTAELFVKGTWEILANYDLYKESFNILKISETSDIGHIKRSFRKLAKEHHPDHGAESAERFYKINNAYQLLMRIIPLMNTENK
ncbi:heat shock protein DnaJ domain-containing protein [Candidatus Magnetomorum sp. HK-1]|nr:heat shock protein DnaJ domain-containing protein [Candidatus Magnetomorum sp. HK-1]